MVSEENIFPKFPSWEQADSSHPVVNPVADTDGYGCTFTCNSENAYYQIKLAGAKVAGKNFVFGFSEFKASDNKTWLQVRVYSDSNNYTVPIDEEGISGAQEYELNVPANSYAVRVRFRHQYDTQLNDSNAVQIEVHGVYLKEVTTPISYSRLNFHKVLQEALPTSVEPGTEHVYYTTDGSRVRMYISTMEGKLIEVTGLNTSASGSGSAKYANSYTQAHIDERKQKIIDLTKKGHCLVFAVATDIHLRIEDGDEGRVNQVRDFIMLSEQLPLDYIICEGDIMSYCQEWDGVFEPRADKVRKIFDQCRCPWYVTRGNHDYNSDDNGWKNNSNIKEYTASNAAHFFISDRDWNRTIATKIPLAAQMEIHYDNAHPENGYYYVDDFAHKHRIIMCNSEETQETDDGKPYINDGQVVDAYISGVQTKAQVEWLIDHALNFTDKGEDARNWVVSLHSHTLPYTDKWLGYAGEDGELGGFKVFDSERGNAADTSEFHGYGWDNYELRKLIHAFQFGEKLDFEMGVEDVDDVNDGQTNHQWITYKRQVDFSKQGAMKVLGYFAGHCHADCHRTVYGLNLVISTCTCASQRKDWNLDPTPTKPAPERNSTNLAMSVNIFVVNLDSRKINVVKIGSKADNNDKTSSDFEMTY